MSAAITMLVERRRAASGLAWRIILVVIAAASVVLELPPWVRAPLSLAAAIAAISFCVVRRGRREPVDVALTAIGGAAVVVVLLGIVLNLLPTGLSSLGWGIGAGAAEVGLMVGFASREPAVVSRSLLSRLSGAGRRRVGVALGWSVLIAAVLAGALVLSLSSYASTHVAPVALGATTTGETITVTATSGRATGPYDLRLIPDDDGTRTLKAGFSLGPGRPVASARVPASTEGTVELIRRGADHPVRVLVLDGSAGR